MYFFDSNNQPTNEICLISVYRMDSIKGNGGEAVEGEQPPQDTAQHTRSNGEESHTDSGATANGNSGEVDAGGQGTL